MDSLVGYGSDDENESDRGHGGRQTLVGGGGGGGRRHDDDTNYDDVNMDMSEESGESEPELPPAERAASSRHSSRDARPGSNDSRDRDRDHERKRRHESPARPRGDRDRADRRSPRRDDRHNRSDKNDRGRGHDGSSRRGLLGDRPDDRAADGKVPALMDLKPFGGEAPPAVDRRSQDARDAVSPRFTERGGDRRERDRERERDRDRRDGRRSEEKKSGRPRGERRPRSRSRSRSRSRGAAFPPPSHTTTSGDRRGSPSSGDYRPSSYKVNKKLEVMEKMGLQIKTPDGSMATVQQLRAAAGDAPPPHSSLPSYYNPTAVNTNKILDQVQKRKLLWSHKNKSEAEEAAKWSGTKFAQDNDGKQATKFMRLMGIKEPGAVKEVPDQEADPNKKQEELFQAMQAQYEVARATTHTMRGVGLGFQRGQY